MAAKKKAAAKATGPKPPSHLQPVDDSPIDGWYSPEAGGDAVHGVLVAREERRGGTQGGFIYKCRLKTGITAKSREGEVDLEPGQTLAFDEKAAFRSLSDKIGCEVWFVAKEKIKLKNGNEMWAFDLHVGPKPSGDNIPF